MNHTKPKPIRETEWGPEQFCRHCPDGGDWWPLTDEFWYFNRQGKTNGPCIACQAEHRLKNAEQPCCVPGCTEPRYPRAARYSSRCLKHLREYERERKAIRRTCQSEVRP